MAKGIALLVGITEVDPDQYGGWDGREGCFGCEKDVQVMQGILRPMGYEVQTLLTRKATAQNIVGGLRDAITELEAGDIFVFYFSGHGGQTFELTEEGDEKDGMDETLVVYDRRIIDDELNEIWMQAREGVRLVMISDSCNSGTNYMARMGINFAAPETGEISIDKEERAEMKAQLIHFGGCQDGAVSAGYSSGGEFTASLCAAWDEGSFSGIYKDFHYEIVSLIESKQKPQYREYGPVTDEFRESRPFQISDKARLSLSLDIVADNPAMIREVVEGELVRIVQEGMEKSSNSEIHFVNEMDDSSGKWSASGTIKKEF
ncbi:caspase family protein [bacterium]|nr:caspase family protein [bacterium]